MFTGIIEEKGRVTAIRPGRESIRLQVRAGHCGRGLKLGESVAVNGCCLTVVTRRRQASGWLVGFDLLKATWELTNLQHLCPGSRVNLERSLAVNGRMGGHFVTGHIDGMGRIARWEVSGRDRVLEIKAGAGLMRYVVQKGSIAVDGISLTVAHAGRGGFRVWINPHTYEATVLKARAVGDAVNLECDLLGKYVARLVGR
jgi:riboflavin synthase